MKKTLLILCIVFSGILAQAQVYSVENKAVVNLNDLAITYIDVGAWMNYMQTKIKHFRIDYGQPMGLYGDHITDKEGNKLNLKSVAQMLNHFDKNGWELDKTIAVANNQTYMSHYIFKRKKE